MNWLLAAKSTKPGSKANMRGKSRGAGAPARVPVGTLHYVDPDNQASGNSMYSGVCGEGNLLSLDYSLDDELPNDLCTECSEKRWAADFDEMQKGMLK